MEKNKLLSAITVFIAVSFSVQQTTAEVWRVNHGSNYSSISSLWGENYGGTVNYPVFKEIDQAIQWTGGTAGNVQAGDTLHVEGSSDFYANATISKRLVIIGPGYFLNENPNTSNVPNDAHLRILSFTGTSDSSQVIGMNIVDDGSVWDGRIFVNTNDVTIKRCRIEKGIRFGANLSDVYVFQNFFTPSSSGVFSIASGFNSPANIYFNNNICQTFLSNLNWSITECNNNVFDGAGNTLIFDTGSFENNILRHNTITTSINGGSNMNVEFNTVSANSQLLGTPNRVLELTMSNLFAQGTTDGSYQLISGAPNNYPGSDGAERGAFGGLVVSNRYTLSGLAAIPVIYDVITTGVSVSGTGLSVTIKARTIK